jgi:hypothetical protein
MRKKNKHPTQLISESFKTVSDNSNESIRYIQKLELQRTVLKLLLSTNGAELESESTHEQENPESINN